MTNTAVLGRDELLSIITRSIFYPTGGPFTPVGQIVQEKLPTYIQSADKRCCGPDPSVLFPAVDALFAILRQQDAAGDAARLAFKTFMTNQKGYNVETVILYFRRGNTKNEPTPEKLSF